MPVLGENVAEQSTAALLGEVFGDHAFESAHSAVRQHKGALHARGLRNGPGATGQFNGQSDVSSRALLSADCRLSVPGLASQRWPTALEVRES